jgi:hypothetical protein
VISDKVDYINAIACTSTKIKCSLFMYVVMNALKDDDAGQLRLYGFIYKRDIR